MHKLPQPVKLWYLSSFFRRERPQAGRFRQFWQVGAEAIGSDDPAVDAELILLLSELLEAVGARGLRLRLSSLGTPATRETYRARPPGLPARARGRAVRGGARAHRPQPAARVRRRPPRHARVMEGAPLLLDHLTRRGPRPLRQRPRAARRRGRRLRGRPDARARPRLLHAHACSSITSDALGAQSGVGGGGRYDGLMEIIGGPPTPGMGWAAGVERILLASPRPPVAQPPLDLYVAYVRRRVPARRVPPRRRRAPRRLRGAARARRALAEGPAQAGGPRRRPLRCDPGRRGDVPQGHGDRGSRRRWSADTVMHHISAAGTAL